MGAQVLFHHPRRTLMVRVAEGYFPPVKLIFLLNPGQAWFALGG
jgi:hypothetical protein